MRRFLLPLALCLSLLALAGCEYDDVRETGISRSQAVNIAERHCPQYPDRFGYVDRATWNPDSRVWVVALTDRDADHGRIYHINRNGEITSTRTINRDRGDYRGGDPDDDYGYYHHGYGPGYYW